MSSELLIASEQPTTNYKLDYTSRINTTIGVTIGLIASAVIVVNFIVKNILKCSQQHSQLLRDIERNTAIISDVKREQSINFELIKSDCGRINSNIREMELSLNSSKHCIETIQKILDSHSQKIERLEASTGRLEYLTFMLEPSTRKLAGISAEETDEQKDQDNAEREPRGLFRWRFR